MKSSDASESVTLIVPTLAPSTFSSNTKLDKAMAVGASLTSVTETVKLLLKVAPSGSVAVKVIEYELFASKSADTLSFNFKDPSLVNSKKAASSPDIV